MMRRFVLAFCLPFKPRSKALAASHFLTLHAPNALWCARKTHARPTFTDCAARTCSSHKTGDITSHYSAPELAELIGAANAVLKAQESALLRVVTKQDQGSIRKKSRRLAPERKRARSGSSQPVDFAG